MTAVGIRPGTYINYLVLSQSLPQGLTSMSEEAWHSLGSPSMGGSEATGGLPCLEPYLPILLPSFDKEEYFSQPAKGEENILAGVTEAEVERETEE